MLYFDLKLGTIIGGKCFPNTGFFEYKDNANQMAQVSYIKKTKNRIGVKENENQICCGLVTTWDLHLLSKSTKFLA
jgi:hypothetical protein